MRELDVQLCDSCSERMREAVKQALFGGPGPTDDFSESEERWVAEFRKRAFIEDLARALFGAAPRVKP